MKALISNAKRFFPPIFPNITSETRTRERSRQTAEPAFPTGLGCDQPADRKPCVTLVTPRYHPCSTVTPPFQENRPRSQIYRSINSISLVSGHDIHIHDWNILIRRNLVWFIAAPLTVDRLDRVWKGEICASPPSLCQYGRCLN